MQTHVPIDEELLAEVQAEAERSGKSVSEFVEDAVRDLLSRRERRLSRERTELPTFGLGGLRPGVSLDNNAALQDLMDEEDSRGRWR